MNYDELSLIEEYVLNQIKEHPYFTVYDLAPICDRAESTIGKIIRKLRDKGYIKRIGSNAHGYWSVIK